MSLNITRYFCLFLHSHCQNHTCIYKGTKTVLYNWSYADKKIKEKTFSLKYIDTFPLEQQCISLANLTSNMSVLSFPTLAKASLPLCILLATFYWLQLWLRSEKQIGLGQILFGQIEKDLRCFLGYCQLHCLNLCFSTFIILIDYGGHITSQLTSVPTFLPKHGIQSEERSEACQHTLAQA